jgi:hypothetical protein
MKKSMCIIIALIFLNVDICISDSEVLDVDEWWNCKESRYEKPNYGALKTIDGYEGTIKYTVTLPSDSGISRVEIKSEIKCTIKASTPDGYSKWEAVESKDKKTWVYLTDGKGSKKINLNIYFDNEGHQIYEGACTPHHEIMSYKADDTFNSITPTETCDDECKTCTDESQECKSCTTKGDRIFDSCVRKNVNSSMSEQEVYDAKQDCLEKAKGETDDCFKCNCPYMEVLFTLAPGRYPQYYYREIKKPITNAEKCDNKCMVEGAEIGSKCEESGKSGEECMDKNIKYYLSCSEKCKE